MSSYDRFVWLMGGGAVDRAIATAEVEIVADTRRFVTDLRRKLRAAFASMGNQIGDQLVERIDRRISQRLNTVMRQAARTSGQEFTREFNQALTRSGLSESLREQLGGTRARRSAARAGDTVADAFGDNLTGTLDRLSEDALDALSFQAAVADAGRAGNDSAQAFADNFRSTIRSDAQRRIADELNQVMENIGNAPQIPAIFRRVGENAGRSFVVGADSQFDDLNQGILNALAGNNQIDSAAFFAGQRSGIQYSDGVFESLQDRLARQMREAVEDATATGIPPLFRRMGNVSGASFADGAAEEIDDSLTATLGRLFQRLGTRQARNSGRDAGTAFGRAFTNALRAVPSAFTNLLNTIIARPLGGLAGVFGEMSSELLSMAGQALAVVALLEALSGLLFALPAATGIAAGGIAALIVPLLGTKDAFSEAFGEAENFEEALLGLTEPARTVARELHAIAPALRDLRLPAQAAFFTEIEGAITEVANNLLGPLSDGLESAAGGFGRIVDQIGEFLAQAETAETISAIFRTLTGIFDALAESTEPFLEGTRILTDEFLPAIEDFEGPLSRIGEEFRDWAEAVTESGAAMEAFERGRDTLDKIFDIVQDISEIFDAMFDAAESVGVDALGSVRDAIADIREEFESIEGQETLGQVFDSLSRIAGVLSDVFGALFANLAELAPDIADLFEEIGPPITRLLDNLTNGIKTFLDEGGREFFVALAEGLADIDWNAIGERIGQLAKQLAPVARGIGIAINGVITFIDIVIEIVTFLNDLFAGTTVSDWTANIKGWFNDVLNQDEAKAWIAETDATIAEFFTETLPQIIQDGLADALEWLVQWWQDIREGWDDLWGGLGSSAEVGLQDVIDILGTQLAAALGVEDTFATDFELDWSSLWDGLVSKVGEALGGIGSSIASGLSNARDAVVNWASGVRADWTAFWVGLLTAAVAQLASIRNAVSSRLAEIRSTISGWISGIRSAWSTFWSGLSSTVQSGLSNVRTRVSNALTGVTDAFRTMYSSVRTVLNNLINFVSGIVSSIRNLVGRISGYVSSAISAAQGLSSIDLNPFANGGIVYGPTPALVGEAGPEVIIPLTRPQRAVDLVQQSGLLGLLAAQGIVPAIPGNAPASAGRPIEITVNSQNADPEQVARRAARLLRREMDGRGLERTP